MPFWYIFVLRKLRENDFLSILGGLLEDQIKIKALTKQQIIISLDRLTRFKFTEDKYLRVFKDILVSNLIQPKFKKQQLDLMDYSVLTQYVEEIFNFSLKSLGANLSGDYTINDKLLAYEKSVFRCDENIEKLLNNKIDYLAALEFLDDGLVIPPSEDVPLNLKWLKSLAQDDNQAENRANMVLKFPIEKVVIVEGITEEILLPRFAKVCGQDFEKSGVTLISAGGKNQVVKLFYQLAETLKLPMFVLLDNDAKKNRQEIQPKLREGDSVYVLESGEFEDVLPLNLIKRTLNRHLRNYSSVSLEELRTELPMTQTLADIFKQRGLEFKKAEFASLVGENIETSNDISPEIELIISTFC